MIALDIRTLVLANTLAFGVYAVVIAMLWRQTRSRYQGIGLLALDMAFQLLGWLLIGLRGVIPDFISITLGNGCVVLGATYGLFGLRRLFGVDGPVWPNWLLVILFVFNHFYFSVVVPDLGVRNLNISLAMLVISAQCVHLLTRGIARSLRRIAAGVSGVFLAITIVSILRLFEFAFIRTSTQDYMHSGMLSAVILIAYQLLTMLLAFQWVLLINRLLMRDMEQAEQQFRKAFQSSPYAILLTRLSDGMIRAVNEGYSNLTGYTDEQSVDVTTLDLSLYLDPEDRHKLITEIATRGSVRYREMQFQVRDGRIVTVLYSGDLIDIDGEPHILSSLDDITARKQAEREREQLICELQSALQRVRQLSGLLPICACCKRIRDDQGYWNQIEVYISEHSDADFSHGLCPECTARLYPDMEA